MLFLALDDSKIMTQPTKSKFETMLNEQGWIVRLVKNKRHNPNGPVLRDYTKKGVFTPRNYKLVFVGRKKSKAPEMKLAKRSSDGIVSTITALVLRIDIDVISQEQIAEIVARCQPVIIRYSGCKLARMGKDIESFLT